MAIEIPGQLIGHLTASTDLSARQFHFVTLGSDGRVALAGAGVPVIGVLQNKPLEDEACTIMIGGVSKVSVPASTLSSGDTVASSSVGKADPVASAEYTVGWIVDGTSGAARIMSVLLSPVGTT